MNSVCAGMNIPWLKRLAHQRNIACDVVHVVGIEIYLPDFPVNLGSIFQSHVRVFRVRCASAAKATVPCDNS